MDKAQEERERQDRERAEDIKRRQLRLGHVSEEPKEEQKEETKEPEAPKTATKTSK